MICIGIPNHPKSSIKTKGKVTRNKKTIWLICAIYETGIGVSINLSKLSTVLTKLLIHASTRDVRPGWAIIVRKYLKKKKWSRFVSFEKKKKKERER